MASNEGVSVDLYLRSAVSAVVDRQQRRVRGRLSRQFGPEHLSVHRHPKRVPVDDDRRVVRRYRAVRRWADDSGVSLSPFFGRRESYDPETDGVREMLTLPVLWLTVTRGSSIVGAYPHVDGVVSTVSEALSRLEAARGTDDPVSECVDDD